MVFSSATFLFVYLPVVLLVYYLLKGRARNYWLLAVSLVFYAWGGISFLPIMIVSILLNYVGGMGLLKLTQDGTARKCWLGLIVAGNLLLLGYWKYFNFLISIVEDLSGLTFQIDPVVLPIGISFFTFQGMSYVIDCYRREVPVQKNPAKVALYISMFPQLIAGPIVRYQDVERQINHREITLPMVTSGIRRFTIGLAKKAILANSLALTSSKIFALDPAQNTADIAWLGGIAYLLQLYFDFSGYSDMAIGLGKMLGFHFLENFDYPFISRSVSEYWRRWHISLGTWFREYVYFPLGGSKCSMGRTYLNIFIVWALTGLWHGANWTFVLWGMMYCVLLVLERATGFHKKLGVLAVPYTVGIAVIAHVVFNSPNITFALRYIRSMFGLLPLENVGYQIGWYLDRYTVCMILIAAFGSTPCVAKLWRKVSGSVGERFGAAGTELAANTASFLLFAVSLVYVMTSSYNPFIYFQF